MTSTPSQAWERRWVEGGRERVQRVRCPEEGLPDEPDRLDLPPSIQPLAQAPSLLEGMHQQLWTDGFLQLAPPQPDLPTLDRGWLTLLASLQDAQAGTAQANRLLRKQVLETVLIQEDPTTPPLWTPGVPWSGLRTLHLDVGAWELTQMIGERACTYAFTVPDLAWEDTHPRPVRLLDTPGDTGTQSAVVFCPPEVTQAELRRQVSELLEAFDEAVGRTFGLRPTATQMAAMLGARHGLDVTDIPLAIETHDLLCLDKLTRIAEVAGGQGPCRDQRFHSLTGRTP